MRSALYFGHVHHSRVGPRPHSFRNAVHFVYLDLEERREVFRGRWFWSNERRNLVTFRRTDYLGQSDESLREAVLDRVEEKLGRRPEGHIGIFTQLRTFGYSFNPVSFYFCHDEQGALDAIVAEITNTPWSERHAYVLDTSKGDGDNVTFRFAKDFHISPFFDLEQIYEWRFSKPGVHLEVSMTNFEEGQEVFNVRLSCERRPMTARNLAAVLLRYPLQPLRLHVAIYWQALRLYLKRTPFFFHPTKRPSASEAPLS
ncbi:MAG: DUF1365 family protein [Planctomycetota bacterium]|jgi:DUF1365 family protein